MNKTGKFLSFGMVGLLSYGIIGAVTVSQFSSVANEATTDVYLQETFDSALNGWTAKGFNGATATVKDEALVIDASDGEQELTFPKLPSADFVLTLQATRLQETAVSGDDIDSFSIKYGIQPDSSGYEVEVNVLQRDKNSGFSYYAGGAKVESDFCGPYNCYAVEYRSVVECDVEQGINRSRIDGIKFLDDEIHVNDTYTYTMIRIGKEMQFYVNGDMIFRQAVKTYKDGALALRVAKGMIFSFDNVTVYSKAGYAEKLIENIGYEDTWTGKDAVDAKKELTAAVNYIERYNVNVENLESKEAYVKIKVLYEQATAPTLTVSGTVATSYKAGDILTLPTATAADYKGNTLAVNYEVIYDNKYLKIEDGKTNLNEEGGYVLRVWVRDVRGVIVEKTYALRVGGAV